ncbi:hypothetical protein IE81DRAFT_42490 [Ceraceosorus guamensis]|uniref:Uncharacterized protein n=1 Tax=Ceraceosorus guamensis TaxID=1522189 RepID=A0A316VNQ5_9BASI|nr:hypothetical protein IE81DRAFT_42490 [Ceraceosorus guamensis]PWN39206.1 hypothetical protein IE81DRAFT_42490 [Ceraceosorus guamensis]
MWGHLALSAATFSRSSFAMIFFLGVLTTKWSGRSAHSQSSAHDARKALLRDDLSCPFVRAFTPVLEQAFRPPICGGAKRRECG